MALIVGDSVFMWLNGTLLNADGARVCVVSVVLTDDGPPWQVAWADGEVARYATDVAGRKSVERRLVAAQRADRPRPWWANSMQHEHARGA